MQATSGTMSMNPTILQKLPYTPGKDLVPVALIAGVPFVLAVNPDLPVHSVADLVKLAKEKPLTYGSGGVGAFHHLNAELFSSMTGIKMTHVPNKGSVPAMTDLISGNIDVLFVDIGPSIQLIRAGKARALGITSAEPAAAAPEIPPLAKVGVPGFDTTAWQMLVAPGGTPAPILEKLNTAVNAIVNTDDDHQEVCRHGAGADRQGIAQGAGGLREIGDLALGPGDPQRRPRRIAVDASQSREPNMGLLHLCLLAVLGLSAALPLAKADDYPSKPVTIVVPYTPGGSTEILARMVGQKLEERLGKPVIVENKPGAGTVIGSSYVAKSEPDGYTLLMATPTPMAINFTLHKQLPYDPAADLVPLVMVAGAPFVLVVHPALPVKSVKELIDYAKANPGKLTYGSGGPGSPHHLYAELLASMTGIKMTHVPYKGTLPALNDVIAGHIQLMFSDVPPLLGVAATGKVRAIGVSTKARVKAFPDVPPLNEAGVPGFDVAGWFTICRAGQDTAAGRRQAAQGDGGGDGAAGDEGADREAQPVADGHAVGRRRCGLSSSRRSSAGATSSRRPGSPARNKNRNRNAGGKSWLVRFVSSPRWRRLLH